MKTPELLDTAVRVWTEVPDCGPERRPVVPIERPRFALVLDTETTTDAAQRLTFGSYRYLRLGWREDIPEFVCAEEGLFHADDLADRDPEGLATLVTYASSRGAEVDTRLRPELRLRSASEFLTVVWQEAIRKRSLIVGFNLPFDLSRLASNWGESTSEQFRRGFSLAFWQWTDKKGRRRENKFRPRLAIKTIDSKRALKGFTSARDTDWIDRIAASGEAPQGAYSHRGHLLDLRTLVFALTDQSHSLASACRTFKVEHGKEETDKHGVITADYIDYNRGDVRATVGLLEKLLTEYYRHPIDLQPTKAYSPASIGKAYLRAFGVTPILHRQLDFSLELLGASMEAFYGGRAECRIRHEAVPVVHVDFVSMYPTVNALLGLWSFHIADRIDVNDSTTFTRTFVDQVGLDTCFSSDVWTRLTTLVLVEPDGDILPVRARYEEGRDGWQIGVNPLWGDPRWYTLADVIASKLLTGTTPRILRAVTLRPVGQLAGLRPLKLRGEIKIDPYRDDPFRVVIERRARTPKDDPLNRFLKIFANGTAYGMLAELNRQDGRESWAQVFTGSGGFGTKVRSPERPGAFTFPSLPSFIAGGGRLMLAILEASVDELGGTYAMCDTDSMSIVASPERKTLPSGIRAIDWTAVEAIRERFNSLNPYDRHAVDSILKLEDVNFLPTGERNQLWCYAISAKRYVHFQRFE
jgi:hypothetical protein